MRKAISEFLELNDDQKKQLWQTATFVFDTNVLLNLYRYSERTSSLLLSAIEELKARIWLPHHIAYEYMRRRCDVIYETIDIYDKLFKESSNFVAKCKESLRLKESDDDLSEIKINIDTWIERMKNKNLQILNPSNDSILDALLNLYDGKIGSPFSKDELIKIGEEGAKRYAEQIPPGFKDIKKGPSNSENAYGDLIIWKAVLQYAKDSKKDVIFITHDQKEDWWNIVQTNKTIGPRTELRKEFMSETSQSFHMYTMESFIAQYEKQHGRKTDASIIEEIQHLDKHNNVRSGMQMFFFPHIEKNQSGSVSYLKKSIQRREDIVNNILNKYKIEEMPKAIQVQLKNTIANLELLKKEYNERNQIR